jgi:hypothetical protein
VPIPVIEQPAFFGIKALVIMMRVRRWETNFWYFVESLSCKSEPPRGQRAVRIDDIVAVIDEHLRTEFRSYPQVVAAIRFKEA